MNKKISHKAVGPVVLLVLINIAICYMNIAALFAIKGLSHNIIQNFMQMTEEEKETVISQIETRISGTVGFNVIGIVFFIVVAIILCASIIRTIARPAQKASKQLNTIIDKINNNEGDLTERIPVNTEDEVGQLINGINIFVARLQEIIQKTQTESQGLSLQKTFGF